MRRLFSVMLERFIQELRTEDPGAESPAATRDRLKGRFAPGSTRRMTLLGMLVGAALKDLPPAENDTVVYASAFGEARALEDYLASFPGASPTLFQTSIHPSGVQQALIGRQQCVRELFPHAGGGQLVLQSLLSAMLAPSDVSILAGGEERGTWLMETGAVSDRAFAYAFRLAREPGARPLGRLVLASENAGNGSSSAAGAYETSRNAVSPCNGGPAAMPMSHLAWFELLLHRRAFDGPVAEGWRLQLTWS